MWEGKDEEIIRRSISFGSIIGWSNSSCLFLRKSLSSSSSAVLQGPTSSYHRLSQSMRLFSEEEGETETSRGIKQRRRRRWRGVDWFRRVLSIRRAVYSGLAGGRSTVSSEEESTERKERRKMSSWLPEPDRRWPLQGFEYKNPVHINRIAHGTKGSYSYGD
ncbi:hypothetical protein HPP92_007540 [Vanilla planifolia]|uniref:Uncharacterized protein n=1 Tax=Vanilla planifolia TaxID=51239 RepID=A0A835RRD8_VANPL|nr:hypothetical protein HPP92_007540 [Vanilla planifolia]